MLFVTACASVAGTDVDNDDAPVGSGLTKNPFLDQIDTDALSMDLLYYTELKPPSPESAREIKAKICEGISTYGIASIRNALTGVIDYLKYIVNAYERYDAGQFWKEIESAAYIGRTNMPYTMKDARKDIAELAGYITNEDVQKDLLTADALLQDFQTNRNPGGVLFAHHILSELYFFGFAYDYSLFEYQWASSHDLSRNEFDIFYGATKLWRYDYPDQVKSLTDGNKESVAAGTDTALKNRVDTVDAEIDQFIQSISPADVKTISDNLSDMNVQLRSILQVGFSWNRTQDEADFYARVQNVYDDLLSSTETCLKVVPEGDLKDDLNAAYGFLTQI